MQAQIEKFSEFNQQAAESMKKVTLINKNLWMNLTQQQMDMVSIYLESSVKQMQSLTEVKDVNTMFEAQSEFFQDVNKKLMNNFRVTFEMMTDAKNEATELFNKGVEDASQNFSALMQNSAEMVQEATAQVTEQVTEAVEKTEAAVKKPATRSRSRKTAAATA